MEVKTTIELEETWSAGTTKNAELSLQFCARIYYPQQLTESVLFQCKISNGKKGNAE
jgi:hypothetical protein